MGVGYQSGDQISVFSIIKRNGSIIKSRVEKSKKEQSERAKSKAEVFTPSWICNAQNNLIDNAWFERENVFNIEIEKGWVTNFEKIPFPDGKRGKITLRKIALKSSAAKPHISSVVTTPSLAKK